MSGKFGTTVIARNTAGAYSRDNTPPTQTPSAYRDAVQERLQTVTQAWRTLTQAQMNAWETAAENNYWTWAVRLEGRFQPCGMQLFVKVNMNTYLFSYPILTPPAHRQLNPTYFPYIDTWQVDNSPDLNVTFDISSMEANTVLQIETTGNLSPGVNRPRPTLFKLIRQIEAADFTQSVGLTGAFTARWPIPVTGQKIFIQTTVLDILTGRKIKLEKMWTVVTAA